MILKREQMDAIKPAINSVRFICLALIGGVTIAAIILSAITDWQQINTDFEPLAIFGLAIGFSCLASAFTIPNILFAGSSGIEDKDTDDVKLKKLSGVFQTKTIVRYAMLEGAAFLNLVLFFVSHNILLLGFVALALAAMVVAFPKIDSVYACFGEQLS